MIVKAVWSWNHRKLRQKPKLGVMMDIQSSRMMFLEDKHANFFPLNTSLIASVTAHIISLSHYWQTLQPELGSMAPVYMLVISCILLGLL